MLVDIVYNVLCGVLFVCATNLVVSIAIVGYAIYKDINATDGEWVESYRCVFDWLVYTVAVIIVLVLL